MWPSWLTWELLNSNLFNALITSSLGALAGAWGGAWAAQKIAEKSVRRKQLWDEIQNCNAGIDAAGAICNAFLNLKGQHLVEMKETYDAQRAGVRAHALGMQTGRIAAGRPFEIGGVDHGSLPEMRVSVTRLEGVMMEKLPLSGRPRGLTNGHAVGGQRQRDDKGAQPAHREAQGDAHK